LLFGPLFPVWVIAQKGYQQLDIGIGNVCQVPVIGIRQAADDIEQPVAALGLIYR
jgi:hypothetical protein